LPNIRGFIYSVAFEVRSTNRREKTARTDLCHVPYLYPALWSLAPTCDSIHSVAYGTNPWAHRSDVAGKYHYRSDSR